MCIDGAEHIPGTSRHSVNGRSFALSLLEGPKTYGNKEVGERGVNMKTQAVAERCEKMKEQQLKKHKEVLIELHHPHPLIKRTELCQLISRGSVLF